MDDLHAELLEKIKAYSGDSHNEHWQDDLALELVAGWTKPPVVQQAKFNHGARVNELMNILQAAVGKTELTNGRIHTHREVIAAYSYGFEAGQLIQNPPVAQQVEPAAHNGLVAGSSPAGRTMLELAEKLRSTTEQMASACSAPMGLWDEHSRACLDAVVVLSAQQSPSQVALDFSSWGNAKTIGEIGAARAQQPPSEAAPSDWVLVPRRPTEAMIKSWQRVLFDQKQCAHPDYIWQAMIEAAPPAPTIDDADAWRTPPPHFVADARWQRHPQSVEEWDRHLDPIGGDSLRSKRRLAFAGDLADPRAPPGMALVSRWDVSTVLSRLTWLEARFKNTRDDALLPAPTVQEQELRDRLEIAFRRFGGVNSLARNSDAKTKLIDIVCNEVAALRTQGGSDG